MVTATATAAVVLVMLVATIVFVAGAASVCIHFLGGIIYYKEYREVNVGLNGFHPMRSVFVTEICD